MVVTTDRLASRVGVDALRVGGNAVDAAVAVLLALAVVNPEAGNVGGGGFLVLRLADGTETVLDHRSVAPRAATPGMFLDAHGEVTDQSVAGYRAAAVPGTVHGLWEAHRRFGSLAWSELVDPAVGLADGFVVTDRFLDSYEPDVVRRLSRFSSTARIFLPDGSPPRKGEVFRQPELAAILARIRDHGADGFYLGETARLIAAEMEGNGGLITREDLAGYRSIWREPIRAHYRGHTIVSAPPPSSGGVALAESCALLERFPLGEMEWHGPRHLHLMAEAWRRAYADRNHYLADPDFGAPPVDVLGSPAYAAWRGRDIDLHRATASFGVAPGVDDYHSAGEHTTHVSIVDPFGSSVSLTTTINSWYGGGVVVEGTGILLNNDMDDFTAKPGAPNQFGLVQGAVNAIAPGKRMLSAMTPVIVLNPGNRLYAVVGTPGGSTITTTVFQVISNLLDHRMNLALAVLAPRVHHQHLPDRIFYEQDGLPRPVLDALEGMGHVLAQRDELAGDVEAILIRPDGTREGVSDLRRGGAALGC